MTLILGFLHIYLFIHFECMIPFHSFLFLLSFRIGEKSLRFVSLFFIPALDLLNIIPVRNITSGKWWFDLDHSCPFIDRRGDQQLPSDAKRFGCCQHGSRDGIVRSLLLSLRENISTGTTRQCHDGRSGTAEVCATRTSLLGRFDHGIQVLVQLVPTLRLMQLVLDAIFQIVQVSRKEGVDQECDTADIEGSFLASDRFWQSGMNMTSCMPEGMGMRSVSHRVPL
jgi:hypothetical protein